MALEAIITGTTGVIGALMIGGVVDGAPKHLLEVADLQQVAAGGA